MRSAHLVRKIEADKYAPILKYIMEAYPRAGDDAEAGFLKPLRINWGKYESALREIFFPRQQPQVFLFYSFATLWVGPHVDDEVTGDYTVGLVLRGNHILFTGAGRRVCDLKPGTVFVLNNKKMHGAKAANKQKPDPLVFVTADFAAESDKQALSYCI